jgi:hypothetical protein
MPLLLNWFPLERVPEHITLPAKTVANWEDTVPEVEALRAANVSYIRSRVDDSPIVVLDAVPSREGFQARSFETASSATTSILNRILERSIGAELRRRGLSVSSDRTGVFAHDKRHTAGTGLLQTAPGVGIRPFRTAVAYGAVIWWDVRTEFKEALSTAQLQKIAVGAPVLSLRESNVSPAGGREFAGVLLKLQGRTKGILRDRRGSTSTIDLADYTLEASPRVLQQYARQVLRTSSRDLLRSVQRASFALDEHGGKNKRVLPDRLHAILNFLSFAGVPRLEFPLSIAGAPPVSLALTPIEAVEQ